jgi:transposase
LTASGTRDNTPSPGKKAGVFLDGLGVSGAFPKRQASSNIKLAEWVLKGPRDGDHLPVGQGLDSATHFFLVIRSTKKMEALRTHVAGVDVHKEMLAITVLIGSADSEPGVEQFECSTFTDELMKCGLKLKQMGVQDVVMESTGVYWKPIYNVWAPLGLNLTIAQAAHVKNVPGRKTDMNDSHWLAQLHRFGLVRDSFIPDEIFQRMRLLSRHRTNLTEDIASVKNRVERVLQDGNVKWSTVVSDTFGKAGMAVLELLSQGVINAGQLALAVTTNVKRKEDVQKALTNCFTVDHVFVLKKLMEQYHHLKGQLKEVDQELREKAEPYRHLIAKLDEIPGIDEILAIGILSEATDDMKHFADERAFAAWAGVAAGNNESAGKKKDPSAGQATLTYARS